MSIVLTILKYFSIAIQLSFMSFLIQPFVLLLIYLFRRGFGMKSTAISTSAKHKQYQFGIIITVHRDTKFILPIVDSLLKQTYPYFNVYVVADDCGNTPLPYFEDARIHMLQTPKPLNTNTKSIDYALEHFTAQDEVMVIFDPDNLVHPKFLEVMNIYYNNGYQAAQANLYSKSSDSLYERMDSIGVVFNNFIDRDIRSELNLSVNIWGSGISVKTEIYRKIKFDARTQTGGFDKFMQSEIAKYIPRLAYAKEAIVYDEKISNAVSLEKQRARWIRSYFKFLPDAFEVFLSGLKRLNFNLTYFGYNLIRPPYFLQIIIGLLFVELNFFVHTGLLFVWFSVLLLFVLSLAAIVMIRKNDKSVLQGLWYTPLFFYHQVRSFLKMRLNKNAILQTENTKVLYIDDILKHEVL